MIKYIYILVCVSVSLLAAISTASERNLKYLLDTIEARHNEIKTYRCRIETVCVVGEKREVRSFDFSFKRPKLIRMKIIEGRNKGATLIYREGYVIARPGGIFGFVRKTFKPDEPAVTTIRGGRMDQMDFWFIIGLMQQPSPTSVLSYRGQEDFQGRFVDVVELNETGKPSATDYAKAIFWIDSKERLILKYELYDGKDRLAFRQAHSDIEINPEFKDAYFNI